MEAEQLQRTEGHLKISGDAIEKIARLATLEVDGVADVRLPASPVNGLKNRMAMAQPVVVKINDTVADITIAVAMRQGAIIPEVCEKVQQNVKSTIQNMTTIAVGRVNITVVGIAPGKEEG